MNNLKERQRYVHPHGTSTKGKILMVASSPAVSSQTGWPIGFWAAELTHPMWVFEEAGYEIELVSTEGGKLEMDGYSNPTDASGYSAHDIISLGYLQKPEFSHLLEHTKKTYRCKAQGLCCYFSGRRTRPDVYIQRQCRITATVCFVL